MKKNRFLFVLAGWTLALVCGVFFAVQAHAAPDPGRAFSQARSGVLELAKDQKRAQQRDQWLKFADTFDELYEKNPKWNNRVAALYRAAAAYDELARRSHVPDDAEKALQRYERLAEKHAGSSLADDALYDAARLANENLRDGKRARAYLATIEKQFAKEDMVAKAKAYAAKVDDTPAQEKPADNPEESKPEPARAESGRNESGKVEAAPESSSRSARLTQVQWQSRKNISRITIELDRAVDWVVYSQKPDAASGRPARLVVDLAGTSPDARIKAGARIDQGILKRLRVDLSSGGNTRLRLDFSDLKRFDVKTEQNPFRLVISAADTDSALPRGSRVGEKQEQGGQSGGGTARPQADMAAQLGLSVRTIIIDAGHGGNDPGTEHNGVVERSVTLAVARKLSDELRRMGYRTRLTRDGNERVELSERAKIANTAKGDVLISIHVNASSAADMQGFETYFLDFASSTAAARLAAVENAMVDKNLGDMERIMADLMLGARTQESRRLATAVQNGTVQYMRKKKLAVRDGGLRSAPFHVLLGAGMPGVLIELGYCTNKTEASRLKDQEYLDALARGIAEGVRNYAARLNK